MLKEFKQAKIVFEVRILVALSNQLKKDFDRELRRLVASINLTIHGITSIRVQIMQLLFNLCD